MSDLRVVVWKSGQLGNRGVTISHVAHPARSGKTMCNVFIGAPSYGRPLRLTDAGLLSVECATCRKRARNHIERADTP